jgi:acetyl-CoA acyltransferase
MTHPSRVPREVVVIDAVRTPFGRAGGIFAGTRADDLAVKAVRELLRRNPTLPPERIGDVVLAATAQVGDQGLTLGRSVALLAGLPTTVPGMAVDRMCAGSLTATAIAAGEIGFGACDVAIAGGVEHMGRHPMGAEVDFNPRFVAERLIDETAAVMGQTAENLHDLLPRLTREAADAFALESQRRAGRHWADTDGVYAKTVATLTAFTSEGWAQAVRDEHLRPDTSLEALASLRPSFRPGGRVTAGNAAGLSDGAGVVLLGGEEVAGELGLRARMRLVGYATTGVEPHLMGLGPIAATKDVLRRAGLTLTDVSAIELNEPFAVQVLAWCDALGVDPADPRLNPYGGAIACGHPLAATGARLIAQLAHRLDETGERYGLTALCVGMGMGVAQLWERCDG